MTDYLSSAAAKELLALIQESYSGELATWSETASRLSALVQFCTPGSTQANFARQVLAINDFPFEDDWIVNEEDVKNEQSSTSDSIPTTVNPVRPTWGNEFDPPILQLIPASTTGLSNWVFHQADPDYFPSIPHGHWQGKDHPKLDPYTGWIYQGSKQTGREARNRIVALWNDKPFRKFARKAIDYYLKTFPLYTGWRVSNPRKLPRRK